MTLTLIQEILKNDPISLKTARLLTASEINHNWLQFKSFCLNLAMMIEIKAISSDKLFYSCLICLIILIPYIRLYPLPPPWPNYRS